MIPVQPIKILCFLFQLLVDQTASTVLSILLLLEFFLESLDLYFRRALEFALFLQESFFFFLHPVICLVTFSQAFLCSAEVVNRLPLFLLRRFFQFSLAGS